MKTFTTVIFSKIIQFAFFSRNSCVRNTRESATLLASLQKTICLKFSRPSADSVFVRSSSRIRVFHDLRFDGRLAFVQCLYLPAYRTLADSNRPNRSINFGLRYSSAQF